MELFFIQAAILLIGSGLAGIQDAKTGLISDKITYSMIVLGILLNLILFDLWGLTLGAVVFGIGYIVYYLGKIGGGDVKIFTGIAFLLPFFHGKIFVLSILVFSAVLAMVFYSIYYSSKYVRKGIDWQENKANIKMAIIFGLIFAACFYFLLETGGQTMLLQMLAVPVFFGLVFLAFETGIRKNFFLKKIQLKKLEEDEIIASDFIDEKTKKVLGMSAKKILGEKEKEKLAKAGIKEILVYRGMPPLGPFIFIAIVLVLAKPGVLELFFI